MSNEVINVDVAEASVKKDYSAYNDVETSELIIGIDIKRRDLTRKDGKKFASFKGYMVLDIYDEEGNYVEQSGRWITLKFTKDAFDDVNELAKLHKPDDLKTGTLYVKSDKLQAPFDYRVEEEVDDNGEVTKKYPEIWVKGGIVGFKKFVRDFTTTFKHERKNQNSKKVLIVEEATGEIVSESYEAVKDIEESTEE